MFVMDNYSLSFSGRSENSNHVQIATFSASKNDKNLYMGITVDNTDLFDATTIFEDFESFKDQILTTCGLNSEEEE